MFFIGTQCIPPPVRYSFTALHGEAVVKFLNFVS